MYTVIKRMEISAAHSLSLSYPSKCEYLHGHNWIITVHCRSKELNTDGMVIDFTHIKQVVKDQLDHLKSNTGAIFQTHQRESRKIIHLGNAADIRLFQFYYLLDFCARYIFQTGNPRQTHE